MADIDAQLPTTISESDDSIVAYGNDGLANRALLTDAAGRLQIDVVGGTIDSVTVTATQRDGTSKQLASDTESRALITRNIGGDIWSDRYLYWQDLCETNGAGLPACKWKTNSGWDPLNPISIQSADYTEYDNLGDANWTIVPKSNNWFLKLSTLDPSMSAATTADCRFHLGEVTDKRIALEFWFSPGGQSFSSDSGLDPTNALVFGLYLFDRRENQEKRYLCRYNSNNQTWQAYNAAGTWTTFGSDIRPYESASSDWNSNIQWSWQYVKLVIDDSTEKIESMTYQDTTYTVDEVVWGSPTTQNRSGLCPYLGAEMVSDYAHTGGSYTGAIYFDDIKVFVNDLQLFNSGTIAPDDQYSTGVTG